MKLNKTKKNIVLLLLCLLITTLPLVLMKGAAFEGADDKAESIILEIKPDYRPWFQSLFVPPSGEVESLLFTIQAAVGAGLIGYYLGTKRQIQKK